MTRPPPDIQMIDGVPIAHIKGDVDGANATATKRQLAEALGPDSLGLVIDLSATRYIDSVGIDMLLRLSDRLDHRRASLVLVIPDAAQLKRLATIVGLTQAIAVRPTVSDALREVAKAETHGFGH
jgi:anti-anti-sigma factor